MADAREKIAPVQGYSAGIPWSLHLRAYDAYCKKYSRQQALIEGGCRGGFSTGELDMLVPGWRDEVSELGRVKTALDASHQEVDALRAELVLLDEVCAIYALDETRYLRDEGEPFGSVPTDAGLKAREAGRRYAKREAAELAKRHSAATAALSESTATNDDKHDARFEIEVIGYAEQRLAPLLLARTLDGDQP